MFSQIIIDQLELLKRFLKFIGLLSRKDKISGLSNPDLQLMSAMRSPVKLRVSFRVSPAIYFILIMIAFIRYGAT